MDFKAHAREEAADDMVNVNTQVSSSMELPFGEYTFFILVIGEKNRQPLGFSASCGSSSAESPETRRANAICVCPFHTAIIQEVCQRYGGCLEKAMGAVPDGRHGLKV